MKKMLYTAFVVLTAAVMVFTVTALVLMWLMGLAFPLLPFSYGQSLALTGIVLLIGLPSMRN